MRWPSKFLTALLIPTAALLLSLGGCSNPQVILGQAYVAPGTLRVRSELSLKSPVVVTLKHGDHLQIVDVNRRMVRVVTDKGLEGWVDSLQLLSPEQMDELKERRKEENADPPEGAATAYETLNVHIDPDRHSPAFAQIQEGGSVVILGHTATPRVTAPFRASGLVISRPKPLSRKQRRELQSRGSSFKLPPKPAPPKAPANWEELSAERIDGDNAIDEHPAAPAPKPQPAAKPTVMEDWTLVRTKHNEIGWVLARNLMMSIPDEVAQYAEGKHIMAFFDMGAVNDSVKGVKHNWLWATAAGALPYDFDSWRVFLWNNRHHRYETSFRKRDLEGYFPIHVEAPDPGSPLRTFQITTKDDDGKERTRTYTFDGHLVHLANTQDYNAASKTAVNASALNTRDLASKASKPGWFKREWTALRHRVFGK